MHGACRSVCLPVLENQKNKKHTHTDLLRPRLQVLHVLVRVNAVVDELMLGGGRVIATIGIMGKEKGA